MDDLISRRAAIDSLDVLCQEHRYKIPGKIETYSQYNEAWQDVLDRAEGAIGNLPSAQPEQRWIPCSERMPEEDGTYIVYAPGYMGGSSSAKEHHNGVMFSKLKKGKWSVEHGYYSRPGCVKAWMPLPEPYSEDENDDV